MVQDNWPQMYSYPVAQKLGRIPKLIKTDNLSTPTYFAGPLEHHRLACHPSLLLRLHCGGYQGKLFRVFNTGYPATYYMDNWVMYTRFRGERECDRKIEKEKEKERQRQK